MEPLPTVRMLVQMGAVEIREAVLVARKVGGHPVEDDADAAAVKHVDEVHEVLRLAVARGRREVPGRLIAPGAVEGVLADRQQLDVGEADRRDVVGERVRRRAIGEEAAVGVPAPRAEVHFVGR